MFNALRYTQEMEKAGFTREQAEVSMKVLIDVMNENFATKSDMKELEVALKSDMKELEVALRAEVKQVATEIRSEMNEMKTELRAEMQNLDYRLTIKLGTLVTVAIGATATLVHLLQAIH